MSLQRFNMTSCSVIWNTHCLSCILSPHDHSFSQLYSYFDCVQQTVTTRAVVATRSRLPLSVRVRALFASKSFLLCFLSLACPGVYSVYFWLLTYLYLFHSCVVSKKDILTQLVVEVKEFLLSQNSEMKYQHWAVNYFITLLALTLYFDMTHFWKWFYTIPDHFFQNQTQTFSNDQFGVSMG